MRTYGLRPHLLIVILLSCIRAGGIVKLKRPPGKSRCDQLNCDFGLCLLVFIIILRVNRQWQLSLIVHTIYFVLFFFFFLRKMCELLLGPAKQMPRQRVVFTSRNNKNEAIIGVFWIRVFYFILFFFLLFCVNFIRLYYYYYYFCFFV